LAEPEESVLRNAREVNVLDRAIQLFGRSPEATEAGVNEKSGAFDRTGSWLRESGESGRISLAICGGGLMKRFIEGMDRGQWTLLPESLDDWISEDNPVRAIDAFVDALDLAELGFKVQPAETGRPSFHPSVHLKLYI
jgi:hypothetical protein